MGLVQEIVALACGLILPRIVLLYFGSDYNGIVNSITQFLAFSTVLRSGIGAVTHVALYKPLAENNQDEISSVMVATKSFMNKIGLILAGGILVFALVYPFTVLDEFDYFFSFSLVIIIGISAFAENMFSIKYKILLQADQKYYIQIGAAIIAQVLATVISIVLIYMGQSIHVVKLGAALGQLSTPLLLNFYVKKKYTINWKAPANNTALKQRWDAFAHQLAVIINNNVDVVILTFVCTLSEVSVYTVYYMVVNNVSKLISGALSGIKPIFGDMMVRGENENLKKTFKMIEWGLFAGCTIIFTVTAVMLTPFVLLYTKGVTDANYDRFLFGVAMVIVSLMNILRIPYQAVVEAAGHFKQTRNGAFLEIILNILCSVVLAYFFGVIGVIIGTFVASIVRTTQFAWYSNVKILSMSLWRVIKNYIVYFTSLFGILLFFSKVKEIECNSYFEWVKVAIVVCAIIGISIMIVSAVFNSKEMKNVFRYVIKRKNKDVK